MFFDFEALVITISRRPKSRQSTEYAPGPRRLRAAVITARRAAAGHIWGQPGDSTGNRERAKPALDSVARIPPTGVRKPSSREVPLPRAIRATTQFKGVPA